MVCHHDFRVSRGAITQEIIPEHWPNRVRPRLAACLAVKGCPFTVEISPAVAVVFALVSLILAACGFALAWSGVKVALDGQAVEAAIGISIGVFVSYGSYLFGRTAWRSHKASTSDTPARARQSRSLRFFFWYALTIIAASLLIPMPGIARVAIGVMVIGGTVVAMAAREDGLRRRK
jgi:hypothetical protein